VVLPVLTDRPPTAGDLAYSVLHSDRARRNLGKAIAMVVFTGVAALALLYVVILAVYVIAHKAAPHDTPSITTLTTSVVSLTTVSAGATLWAVLRIRKQGKSPAEKDTSGPATSTPDRQESERQESENGGQRR
jgi:hypothetical protein